MSSSAFGIAPCEARTLDGTCHGIDLSVLCSAFPDRVVSCQLDEGNRWGSLQMARKKGREVVVSLSGPR